jgi:hypothetical protein
MSCGEPDPRRVFPRRFSRGEAVTEQTVKRRVIVRDPLLGVEVRLQLGRKDLAPPMKRTASEAIFEFELARESRPNDSVVFRGPAAQGPPASRFVYINSGTYAGQGDSPWGRRAKIPLTEIRGTLVAKALKRSGSVLVGVIDGRGRDGGPAGATVPLLHGGWYLEAK